MSIVDRYRMYREANKKLNHKIMESCVERDVLFESARLLGIARGDALFFDSMDETSVLMDFALNEYKVKGRNAVHAYRQSIGGNELELEILDALLSSQTSLFRVVSVSVPESCLLLNDVMGGRKHIALTDIALSETAAAGVLLFIRLVPFESFNMTSGISFAFPGGLEGYLLRRYKKLAKRVESSDDSIRRFVAFLGLSRTDGMAVRYE